MVAFSDEMLGAAKPNGWTELSDRQRQLYEAIVEYLAAHTRPPSIRDLMIACAISSSSVVWYNLVILRDRGFITLDRKVSRGISLVVHDGQPCPVCHRI